MSIMLFICVVLAYIAIASTVMCITHMWVTTPSKSSIARYIACAIEQDALTVLQQRRTRNNIRLYNMPIYKGIAQHRRVETESMLVVSFNKKGV